MEIYDNHRYKWEKASQLESITGPTINASYTYDYTGLRKSKTVGGVTTEFIWAGGLLMAQIGSDGNTFAWHYDNSGKMLGFTLNNVPYFYLRNLQGDVVAVHDAAGNVVAEYEYDVWGKVLSAEGPLAGVNPIRYRGYYWDNETGFYYCQSRYYNPVWCRWISADVFMDTKQGIHGTNMYIYCHNNPIMYRDNTGFAYELALAGAGAAGGALATAAAVGGANFWNPVGWAIGGVVIAGSLALLGYQIYELAQTLPAPGTAADLRKSLKDIGMTSKLAKELATQGEGVITLIQERIDASTTPRNDTPHWHHIVAKDAAAALPARIILWQLFEYGTEDPSNKVWLPATSHSFVHREPYFTWVNAVVGAAAALPGDPATNVRIALKGIGAMLLTLRF